MKTLIEHEDGIICSHCMGMRGLMGPADGSGYRSEKNCVACLSTGRRVCNHCLQHAAVEVPDQPDEYEASWWNAYFIGDACYTPDPLQLSRRYWCKTCYLFHGSELWAQS